MLGTGEVEISDGVVVLRPLNMGDAGDHLAGEDAELVHWLNGGPGTKESVGRHIERVEQMWQNGGPVFTFGIRLLAEDTLIGTIDAQLRQDAYALIKPILPTGSIPHGVGVVSPPGQYASPWSSCGQRPVSIQR